MSPNARTQSPDRLPPHAPEAEAAVLGHVLLDPATATATVNTLVERFGAQQPFYDTRHHLIWAAMLSLHAEGRIVDVITLQGRLRDTDRLDHAGGPAYLSALPDQSTPALLHQHVDAVWTKHLARLAVRTAAEWGAQVFSAGEMTVPLLLDIQARVEVIQREASRHQATPKFLKHPLDFADEFFQRFFGGNTEEPGLLLPIDFKLKIRPGETTLVTGDDGSGKSTLLNFFALHLAAQDAKVALASFEMPPPVTLWILASQLLGNKHQPDATAGMRRVQSALAWLNRQFVLYDFMGIGDWRDVLETFRWAAQNLHIKIFVLDSVMRIGIPDDDYATQGTVAARFAQFAKEHDCHLFFVIHENKTDGKGKARIRGSKLWSANADNVLRVERNATKREKIEAAEYQIQLEKKEAQPDAAEIERQEKIIWKLRKEWDTHIVLQKQRYPGTQQNASRHIYFDAENFQFRAHQEDAAINWLDRWKPRALANNNTDTDTH